ncbi:hypothetical protein F5Y07DRAFT_370526, partial [Xylaria sp. FL0933]
MSRKWTETQIACTTNKAELGVSKIWRDAHCEYSYYLLQSTKGVHSSFGNNVRVEQTL